MIINKYLNPKNDIAFKHIFGKDKHKDILISLLNIVLKNQLHKPIKELSFLKTNQDPEIANDKQSILDVLCEDQDGCKYIIEMQMNTYTGFTKRAAYYAAKTFVEQADEGFLYKNLKEVIFLAFTNYTLFPKKKRYKTEYVTTDRLDPKDRMGTFSFTFVELPKFSEQCKKEVTELSLEEKFYYFLHKAPQIEDEELPKLVGKDKIIGKAFKVLDRFGWKKEELARYNQQEKRARDARAILEKGQEDAKEEGEKKGIEKGKKEIAIKLIQKGKDTLQEISDLTGLPLKELDKIKKSIR